MTKLSSHLPCLAAHPPALAQVYGDVWNWLDDNRVCSLKEKIVEAQFSFMHIDSLIKKMAIIEKVCSDVW